MKEDDATEATGAGEWRRVHPLTMIVETLKIGVQALIPIVFAIYSVIRDEGVGGTAILLGALAMIALLAVMAGIGWLSCYRLRYRIGSSDVKLEQGIISRSARSVPYDRIQDVSLEQKLLPRLLGLVEVKFETGAGGKEELKLSYVEEAEGERLRETVRALADGADGAASTPAEAPADELPREPSRTLFAMDNRRLFAFGLFEFSLVIFAVLLGAAQQLDFLLPYDPWEYIGQWFAEERLVEAGRYVDGMDIATRILGVVYLIGTVVVVGLLSGLAKTFLRDWDFRLDRTPKGFRRRRGLLTRTDVVMPVHRVQALVVSTGWLRRRFGWHSLSFISLAQDSGSANHTVAPFATMEEIGPIADEAGFPLPGDAERWQRPSKQYRMDKVVISVGLCLVAAAAFVAVQIALQPDGPVLWFGAAVMVVLAIVFGAQEAFLWRYQRHALNPQQVVARTGWLAPKVTVADRVKLHSVEITQGPIARWRGYADLRFGMAGGRFSFRGLRLQDARTLRAAVLDSIAAVDFARLAR